MTSAIPQQDARDFGMTLHYAGFHPFPSVNEHGELIDIRMWRWFPDIVEFVTLGSSEYSFAGRVHSAFDYRRPFEHGHVIALQHGHVFDVTRWLLDGTRSPHPSHSHSHFAGSLRDDLPHAPTHRLSSEPDYGQGKNDELPAI